MEGLYGKYLVLHANDGTPLDGDVFVLRPDRDDAAREALLAYARFVSTVNPKLATEIVRWVVELRARLDTSEPLTFTDEALTAASLRRYEVGMGSDSQMIEAPTAAAAAIFYGLTIVGTNNPFAAVVYSRDGEPFRGVNWWFTLSPTDDHVQLVASRVKPQLGRCRLLRETEQD